MSSEVFFDFILGVLEAVVLKCLLDLIGMRIGEPQTGGILGDILGTPQVTKTDGFQEVLVLVYAVEAYAQEAILALELADAAEVLVACARTRPLDACVEVSVPLTT